MATIKQLSCRTIACKRRGILNVLAEIATQGGFDWATLSCVGVLCSPDSVVHHFRTLVGDQQLYLSLAVTPSDTCAWAFNIIVLPADMTRAWHMQAFFSDTYSMLQLQGQLPAALYQCTGFCIVIC